MRKYRNIIILIIILLIYASYGFYRFVSSKHITNDSNLSTQSFIDQKDTLLQARLLLHSGKTEESIKLFAQAIHKKQPNAIQCYLEAIGGMMGKSAAILVSRYLAPIAFDGLLATPDPDFAVSSKNRKDLVRFFRYMTIDNDIDALKPALDKMYPFFIEDKQDALTQQIAKVACLTADKEYFKALELLISIDPTLDANSPGDNLDADIIASPELKNTPYYYIIIQSLRGGITGSLNQCVKLFMERNNDKGDFVREQLALIISGLRFAGVEGGKTICTLTDLMIENGFATDDLHANTEIFGSTTWKNHIYDMKLVGYVMQHKYDEAFDIASKFRDNYKNDDLACNNALYLLGTIYSNQLNEKDKALDIYRRLSKESKFEKYSLTGNLAAISIMIHQPGNEDEVRQRFELAKQSPLMIESKLRTYRDLTNQYFSTGPLK